MLMPGSRGDGQEAGDTEAAAAAQSGAPSIALADLPPLPDRESGFVTEPLLGVCLVLTLSALLGGVTSGATLGRDAVQARELGILGGGVETVFFCLVWGEALLAVLCMLYVLFGNAGVIKRSARTCYPIPGEVEQCLRESRSREGIKNVDGPRGSSTLGTYCVRCLVWRPPRDVSKSHHCSVCQRCVTGFDHHCGVFGRCIVKGNGICFFTLIGMMFAGMATATVAVMVSVADVA